MAIGTVLRTHAGGYLVHSEEVGATLQCAARGRLKKERVSILTGDLVEIDEIDPSNNSAVIAACLPRKSLLSRPQIANVDQSVIVQAIHQPDWNSLMFDRYVVHCRLEIPDSMPLLCINKCDLASKQDIQSLRDIYEPLGYTILFVCAVTGAGMEQLIAELMGKVSVLAGPSGVGKSSLINYMDPGLDLKVGVMENDFGVGRHTTTYSELYPIRVSIDDAQQGAQHEEKASWVADTPGFSHSELKHPEPSDVAWQFPEIAELAQHCKYSNCLHLVETGCHVLVNINKIAPSRYESYCVMVAESQELNKLQRDTSQKIEPNVKIVGGKHGKGTLIPRLNGRYRAASRRTEKQQIDMTDNESIDDNDGLNEEAENDTTDGAS